MPRLTKSVPKYRKHRASGQAVVTINGKDHYLGPHGTRVSKREYDCLISEWLAAGRRSKAIVEQSFTITQLISPYRTHARQHYRRKDGTSTETAENMRSAMRTLRKLYGDTEANDFGLLRLKAVREKYIASGQSRSYFNMNVHQANVQVGRL